MDAAGHQLDAACHRSSESVFFLNFDSEKRQRNIRHPTTQITAFFSWLDYSADRHSASVWLRPEPLQHTHPSFV
jgi:hypothetical protein